MKYSSKPKQKLDPVRVVVGSVLALGVVVIFFTWDDSPVPIQQQTVQQAASQVAAQSAQNAQQLASIQAAGSTGTPSDLQATINTNIDPTTANVAHTDMRHPKNIKDLLRQQSHQEEHKENIVKKFIQERFDAFTHHTSNQDQTATLQLEAIRAQKQKDHEQNLQEALLQRQDNLGKPTSYLSVAGTGSQQLPGQQVDARAGGVAGGVLSKRSVFSPGCKAAGRGCGLPGNTIHTLFTSNGSPYQNWQARIMIGSWHLARATPAGQHLVAMTRILHRTVPDELMEEVDTFRADPLDPSCDKWCAYPVADRGNAVHQWIRAVRLNPSMQKAPWLLMLETDYVWAKPLQAPGDAYDMKVPGLSFAFDYIGTKGNPFVLQMLKEKCPTCDPNTVPNSGPAPVMARFEDFEAATPYWEEMSKWIETHAEAKKALGWVREMYAWNIGVAVGRCNIDNQGPGVTKLIAQPPRDVSIGQAAMYHYTWGTEYRNGSGTGKVWSFDKRVYIDNKDAMKPPLIPMPPEWQEGWKLLWPSGTPVTRQMHDTVVDMLSIMNKAIQNLPDLTSKMIGPATVS